MNEFNITTQDLETTSALELIMQTPSAAIYPAYVGLDVHKETIAVAVAPAGRQAPEYHGEIANKPKNIAKLVARLSQAYGGEVLLFSYEAGPCGYTLHRQILSLGHDCEVVAPSKIPSKPGERIKTDRRDSIKLAASSRSGNLTAVWVPDIARRKPCAISRVPVTT